MDWQRPTFYSKLTKRRIRSTPASTKGGSKSEETGGFLPLQNRYSISQSLVKNLEKFCTDLAGKFNFFSQDSSLEYSFWRSKNPPVSSDLKPPLDARHQTHLYF